MNVKYQGSYLGYIIDGSRLNPIQVWIPDLKPYNITGRLIEASEDPTKAVSSKWKTFGKNAGNSIGVEILNELRTLCAAQENWFLTSMPLSASANENAMFNETYDMVYNNSNQRKPYFYDVNDPKKAQSVEKSLLESMPPINSRFSNPGFYALKGYLPNAFEGFKPTIDMNNSCGHWVRPQVGTRVKVTYLNNSAMGVIDAQIPFTDETSRILRDTLK